MWRFAADAMGVIATHRGRGGALPGLRKVCCGTICVGNGRLCMGGSVMFLVEILTL